jgi:hypothetical protein
MLCATSAGIGSCNVIMKKKSILLLFDGSIE